EAKGEPAGAIAAGEGRPARSPSPRPPAHQRGRASLAGRHLALPRAWPILTILPTPGLETLGGEPRNRSLGETCATPCGAPVNHERGDHSTSCPRLTLSYQGKKQTRRGACPPRRCHILSSQTAKLLAAPGP